MLLVLSRAGKRTTFVGVLTVLSALCHKVSGSIAS